MSRYRQILLVPLSLSFSGPSDIGAKL